MKCIWLGQAGLLFEFDDLKVMVDPYFSNSIEKVKPGSKRRIDIDQSLFNIEPDILILTHDHIDHTDPETLSVILKSEKSICVLASQNAWKNVREYGNAHNYVMFDRNTEWTYGPIHFRAVHAQHSDAFAIGFLLSYQDHTYYVTGDTLYHSQVISDVKESGRVIDAVFLPINGIGNNMNMTDAARFASEIRARKVIPIHFGLYDEIDPQKDFCCENKVVPVFYQEIPLDV